MFVVGDKVRFRAGVKDINCTDWWLKQPMLFIEDEYVQSGRRVHTVGTLDGSRSTGYVNEIFLEKVPDGFFDDYMESWGEKLKYMDRSNSLMELFNDMNDEYLDMGHFRYWLIGRFYRKYMHRYFDIVRDPKKEGKC